MQQTHKPTTPSVELSDLTAAVSQSDANDPANVSNATALVTAYQSTTAEWSNHRDMSSTTAPPTSTSTTAPLTSTLPPKPLPTAVSTTTTTATATTGQPSHLTIDKTAVVCDKAILDGTITIAANTIVHPRARLIAPPGTSIAIGANSIVEEAATIIAPPATHLTLGNWVMIEPMAVVSASMGHANWVRVGGVVAEGVRVGRGVEIGVRAVVDGVVEDGSVVASDGSVTRPSDGGWTAREREKRVMEHIQLQLMGSRDLIIKAHKLIR